MIGFQSRRPDQPHQPDQPAPPTPTPDIPAWALPCRVKLPAWQDAGRPGVTHYCRHCAGLARPEVVIHGQPPILSCAHKATCPVYLAPFRAYQREPAMTLVPNVQHVGRTAE